MPKSRKSQKSFTPQAVEYKPLAMDDRFMCKKLIDHMARWWYLLLMVNEANNSTGENEMKIKIEAIIRSQSIAKTQAGYNALTSQVAFNVHPAEFVSIWDGIDWLSQDGYEGN